MFTDSCRRLRIMKGSNEVGLCKCNLSMITNGRVPACLHRVRTPSGRESFMAVMSPLLAADKGTVIIRPMDKLIYGAHRPLDFEVYAWFNSTDDAREHGIRTLEAFCGVKEEGGDDEDTKKTAAAD